MPSLRLNPKSVYTIAKKEFVDNVRSRWIVAMIIIFFILTLATSYLAGAGGSSLLGGMEETVVTLMGIVVLLIPIIAIMLGYSAISGESESGSLSIVLAYPVRRNEVLLGKIVGLGSVIALATLVGFGVGGLLIAASAGAESWAAYLAFVAFAIILGLVDLSLAILFSTLTKRRVTSLAAGVGLFFWSMIYEIVILGVYMATGGDLTGIMAGRVTFPDWIWASLVVSPGEVCEISVVLVFGINQFFGFEMAIPSFLNIGLLLAAQFTWIIVSLALAFYVFKRRDI